jgi:S-DNA-T family DNA segregation ATPase FtsK/SpoIIIE
MAIIDIPRQNIPNGETNELALTPAVDDAEIVVVGGAGHGKQVDPPIEPRTLYGTILARKDSPLTPIVPAWMRNRNQAADTARWLMRYTAYAIGVHTTRSPKYAARITWRSIRGAGRVTWLAGRWCFDREGLPARLDAVRKADADKYLNLSKQRDRRIRSRIMLTLLGTLGMAGTVTAGLLWAPWWVQAPAGLGAAVGLAKAGSPEGKPITDRVSIAPAYIRLTAELTRKALIECGAGIKNPEDITFVVDIRRDGPGHTAVVDLPPGIIATDVIDKRERLAAGFRLPKTQVWPATMDGEHPGRLQIWVADKPVSAMKAPTWPLLTTGTTNYFQPFTFGFDERQRPVTWRLDEKNSLFGGIPGSGKSFAVRTVALAGALDPLVNLVVFELKGSGDFDCLEDLCIRYGSGADEVTKDAALEALRWLEAECDRRGPLVKQWARKGLNSENKVNRAMCMRDPRLRPILAIFDEIQELFTDPDRKKEAVAIATSVVKRGRALGIHLVLATQRIDKESIPRGISSNMGVRFCMAVTSHVEADLVLGTGAYSRGARPTEFEPGPDSGWGWRAGIGRAAPVRAAFLDNTAATKVVARAKQIRQAAGTLDHPADELQPVRDVLVDVRGVYYAGEAFISWPAIAARLAEHHPTMYAQITPDVVSAQIRALGVKSENGRDRTDGNKVVKGAKLDAIEAAIARRQIESAL